MPAKLSIDAMTLRTALFSGAGSSFRIGGEGAKNVMTARASEAMDELIRGGYVIARPYNRLGRMEYVATPAIATIKPYSLTKMSKFGKWSATRRAPDVSETGSRL